jgi:hypothetical protein
MAATGARASEARPIGPRERQQRAPGARNLLIAAALLCASAGISLGSISMAAGVYGVYGIPVLQEDTAPGSLYGVKLRADLFGPFGAEAFHTSFQEGDVRFTTPLGEQRISGGTESVTGGNLILGST